MEGEKIEVKSIEIKNLLEFNKRYGKCRLILEQDYEGTSRDRIIAKVKGNGLQTNLKKIDGLKKNEKAVAESLDKLSIMSSNKQYKLDKLITILDTMEMKGDELKVKEVFERNSGNFIANMVRSGGDRGERAVVYSRLDRKMEEDKGRVWADLKKRNNKYEGNKIEERYSEKSTGVIIGCDHNILISSKAVERARIGVYGKVT
ncbi:MAG: hypothetical protein LBJ98_04550, partial [Endomicrobium sp.]|nr:hypothetical protein [Endomicrobium sp.]